MTGIGPDPFMCREDLSRSDLSNLSHMVASTILTFFNEKTGIPGITNQVQGCAVRREWMKHVHSQDTVSTVFCGDLAIPISALTLQWLAAFALEHQTGFGCSWLGF